MRKFILFSLLVFLAACEEDERFRKTLDESGYTNVKLTGYAPFACGKDDDYGSKFEATNPAGKRVKGAVCCGFLKGCTVRF